MKAIKQYFPVVLYKVIVILGLWMKSEQHVFAFFTVNFLEVRAGAPNG